MRLLLVKDDAMVGSSVQKSLRQTGSAVRLLGRGRFMRGIASTLMTFASP